MKRLLSKFVVFALCLTLVLSCVCANEFVPSIGDKDHPEIVPESDGSFAVIVDNNGQIADVVDESCLVITPVSEANTSAEIPQASRGILLNIYKGLTDGSMELPYEQVDSSIDPDQMVIRDLFDLSFLCEEHPEMLENGHFLRATFDLGVAAGEVVVVMVFVDGQWVSVEAINNGDGTVTCLFSQVCPVAISVRRSVTPPQTGDNGGQSIILWSVVMLLCAAAIVACAVIYRKKFAKRNET